jgi:hypothetical protein
MCGISVFVQGIVPGFDLVVSQHQRFGFGVLTVNLPKVVFHFII